MSKAKQVRESKERHQRLAKEASAKRVKENAVTFGTAFEQILAAGEPVEGWSIGYRVSKEAINRLIIATQGKEKM